MGFPSNTKLFEPAIKEELGHADGDAGISDELTLFERGSADCRVSRTEGLEEKPLAEKKHSKEDLKDENEIATAVAEDDENNYPKPLGLFILITGIALSVFLISLDRTIITTVSFPSPASIMRQVTDFQRQFRSFQRNSSRMMISVGMVLDTC